MHTVKIALQNVEGLSDYDLNTTVLKKSSSCWSNYIPRARAHQQLSIFVLPPALNEATKQQGTRVRVAKPYMYSSRAWW